MSQFIIATEKASAVQRNAITEHLKSKGWAFWHHFEEFWMTVSHDDSITSHQLFKELRAMPVMGDQLFMIVIRLPVLGIYGEVTSPMTHAGFGPKAGWEWTQKYWGKAG